jgi:periplasmic protein TonB
MESKALVMFSWDEIVFEHRNQSYGAYLLRKLYIRRLLLGLGASVTMIASMVFTQQLLPVQQKPLEEIKVVRPQLYPPPIVPPKERPQPPENRVRQNNNANTQVLVTTEPVETPVDPEAPVSETEGNETGPVQGILEEGIGAAPAVTLPKPEEIVMNAELMPKYDGGMEGMMRYLVRNMKYPATARRMMLEGTVFVSFVVNGDGTVSQVQVIKGFHPDCDKEAVRVISSMPGWTGGKQNGFPVGVRMVLPIKFRLQ